MLNQKKLLNLNDKYITKSEKSDFLNFRYDLGTMPLNKAGKLRKYHQFIGVFSTKKGTFDHKSTNQPKPPEESESSHFIFSQYNNI